MMQDDKQILKFICYTVEYIVHSLSALCVVHHLGHNLDYASEIVNMSTVSYVHRTPLVVQFVAIV